MTVVTTQPVLVNSAQQDKLIKAYLIFSGVQPCAFL